MRSTMQCWNRPRQDACCRGRLVLCQSATVNCFRGGLRRLRRAEPFWLGAIGSARPSLISAKRGSWRERPSLRRFRAAGHTPAVELHAPFAQLHGGQSTYVRFTRWPSRPLRVMSSATFKATLYTKPIQYCLYVQGLSDSIVSSSY